eukprot:scaffold532611_cov19-Prasinocladus_malaysianus.AAC.1
MCTVLFCEGDFFPKIAVRNWRHNDNSGVAYTPSQSLHIPVVCSLLPTCFSTHRLVVLRASLPNSSAVMLFNYPVMAIPVGQAYNRPSQILRP